MDSFRADVASGYRSLVKRPAFALTAIATLALGIGATAAIFSVVNAVLLRPLPYAEPSRLVHIWQDMRNRNVSDFAWPAGDFHDLRERVTMFEGVAALSTGRQVIAAPDGQGEATQLRFGQATPNLFRLLGARVALGTDFTDADGMPPAPQGPPAPGAAPAAPPPPPRTILSHEFWQRQFGGKPDIVGTVVSVGDVRFDVIGVLEPGFELLLSARHQRRTTAGHLDADAHQLRRGLANQRVHAGDRPAETRCISRRGTG